MAPSVFSLAVFPLAAFPLAVFLLALSQAALITTIGLVLSASALIGRELASPGLATLPLAVQYLATTALLYPAARLGERFGRRPVFVGGAALGAVGLLAAAWGVRDGSFAVFVAAGVPIGAFSAVGQYYRFAAAEAVAPERRASAVSLTLAGGVLAAVAGPALARWSRDLLLPSFTASFLILAVVAAGAAVLALGLRLPHMGPTAVAMQGAGRRVRSLREVAGDRRLVLAVAAGVVGYGVMNLLMTATPLAMMCVDLPFEDTASVIQWHLVAMFAPSFFTGALIRRIGVVTVIVAGCAMTAGSIGVAAWGEQGVAEFHLSLIVLGVGWNFLYVGATVLLAGRCRPAEKGLFQAVNDTLMFLAVAVVTLASAGLVDHLGWPVLNLVALVPVVAVVALAVRVARPDVRTPCPGPRPGPAPEPERQPEPERTPP